MLCARMNIAFESLKPAQSASELRQTILMCSLFTASDWIKQKKKRQVAKEKSNKIVGKAKRNVCDAAVLADVHIPVGT